MKYDNIIIGGGLSGLMAGIVLAKVGQKTCIISAGQNSLHFFSGSFELLGYTPDGQTVEHPLEAMASLPEDHPYRLIGGVKEIKENINEVLDILSDAGIPCHGEADTNHLRLTPTGVLKPAWLTLDEYFTCEKANKLRNKSIDVINIKGFLDSPVAFLSDGLRRMGAEVNVCDITTPTLQKVRENPTEMRATSIAKYLEDKGALQEFVNAINALDSSAELILLPAVLGFHNDASLKEISKEVSRPVKVVATLPPAVSGVRTAILLRKLFLRHGGTILTGDTATEGIIADGRVTELHTEKLPGESLVAKEYILASGSFLSHGLSSDYDHVFEPVFGVDVKSADKRSDWTSQELFDKQSYMDFGVVTDKEFHAMKDGKPVENLHAIGSILCNDGIKLANATGVSMLTATNVAFKLFSK
jgi:glycerol-3-phosphate dehydrogenase subunit B